MTNPITTIELDAVEPSECQYKNCHDEATRMFAVQGDHGESPAVAGYCHVHQLQFARESDGHTYLGTPKRASDFEDVEVAHE